MPINLLQLNINHMTCNDFISACKLQGVTIRAIRFNKGSVYITYYYNLPNNTLSSKHTSCYTYIDNKLQSIYNDHFSNAGTYVRF